MCSWQKATLPGTGMRFKMSMHIYAREETGGMSPIVHHRHVRIVKHGSKERHSLRLSVRHVGYLSAKERDKHK